MIAIASLIEAIIGWRIE